MENRFLLKLMSWAGQTMTFPGVDLSRISFLPLIKEFFEGVIITDRLGCVLFVNDEQARIDRRQYQQKTFGNQPNRPVM